MTVYPNSPPLEYRFTVEGQKKVLIVDLPSLQSLKDVDLDISSSEIRLLLPGKSEHLQIPLPLDIYNHVGPPSAKFSRKRGMLTVAWDTVVAKPIQEEEVVPATASTTNSELRWQEKRCLEGDAALRPARCVKEKDCLNLLRAEVEHALKQCTVERLQKIPPLQGASVLLSDFAVKGNACIKKLTCHFAVSVTFSWEVLDAFGGLLGVRGTGDILELTPEEVLPRVAVKAATSPGAQAGRALEWMRHHGVHAIAECLSGKHLSEAVLNIGGGITADDGQSTEQHAEVPTMLEGKSTKEWAHAWLTQKLGSLNVKLFGGLANAAFSSPQVSGDVSFSTQQGEPIMLFKLRVLCNWVVMGSTGGTAQAQGTLLVVEFTPEKGAEGCTVNVEATPGKKSSGQFLAGFRQVGVSAVRGILAQFLTELQLQLDCPASTA